MNRGEPVLGEVGYQPLITLAITPLVIAIGITGLRFLLHQLKNHYRAPLLRAIDSMEQGIVLFSEERTLVFCNRRYREIYRLTSEQVKPGTPIEQLPHCRLEVAGEASGVSDEQGRHWIASPVAASKAIHEFSDGRIITCVCHPIPGGGDVATHEDVTVQETLHRQLQRQYDILNDQQEQLRARALQFDAVLKHMSEALCFFDKEERLIVCNDRFAEMYNLQPEAISPGMTLREIINLRYEAGSLPAMSSEAFYASRNALLTTDAPSDTVVKQTNGRVFVIHHRPMPDGGWIATHADITEREMLHSQLRDQLEIMNEQRLALHTRNIQFDIAINNISQGLCFFDGEQRLIICNNRYIEMYNLDPESISPGITLREIIDLRYEVGSFPAMTQDEYHAWRNKVAVEDATTDTVVELKDGRVFEIHHRPMPDGGWVASHADITQQRRAEEQNRLMVDCLRTAQDELTDAVTAAQASNDAKSSFLANMSHEIRTPLNGILGMAQVLENEQLTAIQQENVKTILDSGQTLMILLNDVLDLSKIEAGKLDIVPVETETEGVFLHLQKLFLPKAVEKSIELSVDIGHLVPKILKFDYVRIHQCMANLISNAIKFTRVGSVRVSVRHEVVDPDEYLISVAVADSGIGISEEAAARLFAEFSQADESTTRQFGGTGLGLVISRKLARMMGGDISLASQPGEGSTFTLTFRAGAALSPKLSPASPSRGEHRMLSAPLPGLKILLVDDNTINRNVVRLLLSPSGVVITEAANGKEALDRLAEQPFDLVLLDVHMPVMDGPETIGRIRAANVPWSKIPVIALTADAMTGDKERLISLGMTGYASKPIEQRALIHEIHRVLSLNAVPEPATDEIRHVG